MPPELQLLSTSPVLAAYQYTARPFSLEIDTQPYPPGDTIDQVVDFAYLSSQVSAASQVVTEANYFVKTRGNEALRLTMPGGASLWDTQVDDTPVTPRTDGSQLLVPLPPQTNANHPSKLLLRFGQAASRSGATINLSAPRLAGGATVVTDWSVSGDSGRLLVPRGGSAEPVRPPLTETGFEWISGRAPIATLLLLLVAVLSAGFLRNFSAWRLTAGLISGGATVLGTAILAADAYLNRRPNVGQLDYAASLVSAGDSVIPPRFRIRPTGEP